MLAEGPGALYVAFIGTKHPRDLLADVNAVQAPLHEAVGVSPLPRCHRGFLTRARAIPIVHLYAEARRRKRRLVLCGHSLGGAVAAVSALRLLLALSQLPSAEPARAARGLTLADDALPQVRARCLPAGMRMSVEPHRLTLLLFAPKRSCVSSPSRSRQLGMRRCARWCKAAAGNVAFERWTSRRTLFRASLRRAPAPPSPPRLLRLLRRHRHPSIHRRCLRTPPLLHGIATP